MVEERKDIMLSTGTSVPNNDLREVSKTNTDSTLSQVKWRDVHTHQRLCSKSESDAQT